MSDRPRSIVVSLPQLGTTPQSSKQTITNDARSIAFHVIEEKRGGMGVVYICKRDDASPDEPLLALKTFDDRFFFELEMQSIVHTESQTWLRVSDISYVLPLVGIISCDNKPHLIMPGVMPSEEGDVTLADEIARSPGGMDSHRVLSVLMCLSGALMECRKRIPGLIYGDIKPDNVLLMNGTPMLADFGTAHVATEANKHEIAVGTALYLAPECWGTPDLTAAADVYAIGITLYQMIAGDVPFSRDDPEGLEDAHKSAVIAFNDPPKDDLEQDLREIALKCLEKDPANRPEDSKQLFEMATLTGMAADPGETLSVMHTIAGALHNVQEPEFLSHRVETFLREDNAEAALELLEEVPEEQLEGRLLILYGTTYSLLGDDEKALSWFARVLNSDPDDEDRINCVNEMGLSLKRLGRFEEAKILYESIVGTVPREHELMLSANYAATLMELGHYSDAICILQRLTRNNNQSGDAWALLADACARAGELSDAIAAINKAIQVTPNAGHYRIALAEYLIDYEADVGVALKSLELAKGLGVINEKWIALSFACHLLLDEKEPVAELIQGLKIHLSESEVEGLFGQGFEKAREVAGRLTDDSGFKNKALRAQSPPSNLEVSDRNEATEDLEEPREYIDEEEMRVQIRNGHPYLQIRMSDIDQSMLYDFYCDVEREDFPELFAEAVAPMKIHMMSQELNQRAKPYAFAKCPNCAVVMLSQRDEGELYNCQGCRTRVGVDYIPITSRLEGLIKMSAEAAGVEVQSVEPGVSLVGVAIPDVETQKIVTNLFMENGYERLEQGNIHNMFVMMAYEKGVTIIVSRKMYYTRIGDKACSEEVHHETYSYSR